MRFTLTVGMMLLSVNVLAQAPAAPQGGAPGAAPAAGAAPAGRQGAPAGTGRAGAPASGAALAKAARGYDDVVVEARTFLKASQFKEALEASERAMALDDKRWGGYVTAASAYSSQGLLDDAIGMLQAALPRAPEDRKALIRDALAETRRVLASPTSQAAAANAAASASAPTQAEIVLWKTIENSKNVLDFSGYLGKYPDGLFAPLAKARVAALNESTKTPQQKAAESVARIVALTDNVKLQKGSQKVFGAGCLLSVVVPEADFTIDLRQSFQEKLKVSNPAGAGGLWQVSGFSVSNQRGTDRLIQLGLITADQVSVSQLFALLPDAIGQCRAAAVENGDLVGRGRGARGGQ